MPLYFMEVERKDKGIRVRFVTLLATKGGVINKGSMLKLLVKRCCPVRNY
ncbi:MAG: hypothetical protein LBL39_05725 [Planctomycetaceae bacterium]|nr:hypothetical protein [Planctomycetaceae bacterium]